MPDRCLLNCVIGEEEKKCLCDVNSELPIQQMLPFSLPYMVRCLCKISIMHLTMHPGIKGTDQPGISFVTVSTVPRALKKCFEENITAHAAQAPIFVYIARFSKPQAVLHSATLPPYVPFCFLLPQLSI